MQMIEDNLREWLAPTPRTRARDRAGASILAAPVLQPSTQSSWLAPRAPPPLPPIRLCRRGEQRQWEVVVPPRRRRGEVGNLYLLYLNL